MPSAAWRSGDRRVAEQSHTDAYLERVRTELRLPPDLETDIVEEIRGHLADTTTALVDEGLDQERAEREALARLGAPDVMAERLRRAHQTRRRLFAAAGGGVWAAGTEGLYALIFGSLFLGVALVLAAVATLALSTVVHVDGRSFDTSFNTGFAGLVWAFAAERGGRAATLVVGARSRRCVGAVRWPIAAVGAGLLGWLVLGVIDLTLDWPAVVTTLAIPAGFALGALRAKDGQAPRWRAHRTWPLVLAVAGAIVGVSIVLAAVVPSAPAWQGGALAERDALYRFDRIGPDLDPSGPYPIASSSLSWVSGGPIFGSWTVDPAAIATVRDVRLELWRSIGPNGPIAADAVRPAATVPLEVVDGSADLTVNAPRYRDLSAFWLVVTGIDRAGQRVRMTDPDAVTAAFRGTLIDWFQASDTPDR